MAHKFHLNIANILIEVESELSPTALGIESRLHPFLGIIPNPVARVFLCWEKAEEKLIAKGVLIFDPGSILKIYREDNLLYAFFHYQSNVNQALLITDEGWNNIVLREQVSGKGWSSLLNIGAGELIIRAKLSQTKGLLFHSSGIIYGGKAVIFVGHSGEGKSTMMDLWKDEPEAFLVNDDRIAVRVEKDEALCYGTPWAGTAEIASNRSAPLRAIVLMEKAPENEILQIPQPQASPLLLARACIPWWNEEFVQLSLETLDNFLRLIPVYLFRWRPEKEAIELLKSIL